MVADNLRVEVLLELILSTEKKGLKATYLPTVSRYLYVSSTALWRHCSKPTIPPKQLP